MSSMGGSKLRVVDSEKDSGIIITDDGLTEFQQCSYAYAYKPNKATSVLGTMNRIYLKH